MSFIGDFFKSLAVNPNVVDDEAIAAELNQFLSENSESNKRIAFLENNISLDKDSLKKAARKAIQKIKANGEVKNTQNDKSVSEKEENEIEK